MIFRVLLLLLCLIAVGCSTGGGDESFATAPESSPTTNLSLQVDFGPRPQVVAQQVDRTVETIRVSLTFNQTGTLIGLQEVTRPAVGTVSTVAFGNVPIGNVTVTADFFNAGNELLGQDTQTLQLQSGLASTATLSFTPPIIEREYVVAANTEELLVFQLDEATGGLTQVFSQNFGAGSLPFSVDVRADGNLYVAFNLGNLVEHFQVNAETGALTSQTQLTRTLPEGGVVSRDGRFYYHCEPTLVDPGSIRAYALDEATGVPTELAGSPFIIPGSNQPQRIFIHPNGRFMYVAERAALSTNGVFYTLEIDNVTGALTQIGGAVMISAPRSFAFEVSPDQNTLYVVGNGPQIDGFTINQTTGALTPVAPAFPNAVDGNLAEMVVDTNRNILYICGFLNGQIEAYNLDATGRPTTPLAGSPYAIGTTGTLTLDRDSSGQFLIATSTGTANGTVASFLINADGTLTAAPGSPFAAGTGTFDHDIVRLGF